mmetsp:Transcript_22235/g.45007  ORF Transcript_22235/g.45007 Transcript_22235/m.45007 type:complete len:172 (-) Transcript_22235:314-829(-)
MSSETDSRTVKLISREGDAYELPAEAAKLSKLVKDAIDCENDDDDEEGVGEVVIAKVKSDCLRKVVEFLKHYAEDPMTEIESPLKGETILEIVQEEWYRNFIEVDQPLLFELVTAGNFMDIKPLLDLACLKVSVLLMGKNAEEIRVMLNLPKMTPEQEQEAREKHPWIFQD